MILAPVVIFSYNRPEHLFRVLSSLAKNDLADETTLFIYCDGAKSDATKEEKAAVCKNYTVAESATGFKKLCVIKRPFNYGLADNIIGAVNDIVNQYGRVITLEDDVITSRGFIRYMNEALDMYEQDERVMHISGFMWHYKGIMPETFFYTVPECGGGWATWRRAWSQFDGDARKLCAYWCHDWNRFNIIGGTNFQNQLEDNASGQLKTWFIKWYAVVLKEHGLTLYPRYSLTTNIGFDGSGTNCTSSNNPFYWNSLAEKINVERIPIRENVWARYQIYCCHQGRFYSKRNRKHIIKYFRALIQHIKYEY